MEIALYQDAVEEINQRHALIVEFAKKSIGEAIRIGELLTQIKGAMRHGEWLPWLAENIQFSHDAARNYRRLYEIRDDPRLRNVRNLSEAYSIALISSGKRCGEQPSGPPQLHESTFWIDNSKISQKWFGTINHELKDRPLEKWRREQWIDLASTIEPFVELYCLLKSLIG